MKDTQEMMMNQFKADSLIEDIGRNHIFGELFAYG